MESNNSHRSSWRRFSPLSMVQNVWESPLRWTKTDACCTSSITPFSAFSITVTRPVLGAWFPCYDPACLFGKPVCRLRRACERSQHCAVQRYSSQSLLTVPVNPIPRWYEQKHIFVFACSHGFCLPFPIRAQSIVTLQRFRMAHLLESWNCHVNFSTKNFNF